MGRGGGIENEISQEAQFIAEGGYVQAVFAHYILDYSQIVWDRNKCEI